MEDKTYSKIEKFVETFWGIVGRIFFGILFVVVCSLGILMLSVPIIGFFTSIIASQVVAIVVSVIVILAILTVGVLTIIVVAKQSRDRNRLFF